MGRGNYATWDGRSRDARMAYEARDVKSQLHNPADSALEQLNAKRKANCGFGVDGDSSRLEGPGLPPSSHFETSKALVYWKQFSGLNSSKPAGRSFRTSTGSSPFSNHPSA